MFRFIQTSLLFFILTCAAHAEVTVQDVWIYLFRKEVLALDECVREEFLKLYVAYKAETNFVDVVPQVKRLRLSLNMEFTEVDDPRGMCRDVTKMKGWGNGCVEVGLENEEDLQYVIGLVRQALERQLGEDEVEE